MPFFSKQSQEEERIVITNKSQDMLKYGTNRIISSKYTWYTFIPKIAWEHVKRFMNFYFILIGILQCFPQIAAVNLWTTWGPIIFIFGIAIVREGLDDYRQHKLDKIVNERKYDIIRDNQLIQSVNSEDILVGDIVRVNKNEEVPTDMVIVYSSHPKGKASITTSNLDGETSLKERYALPCTNDLGIDNIKDHTITIECSAPNDKLYDFDSRLTLDTDTDQHSLSIDQLLQQGVFIRNIDFCYGITVYSGMQTKLSLSTIKPPTKWTQVEQFVNMISKIIFIIQISIALIFGLCSTFYVQKILEPNHQYLLLGVGEANVNRKTAFIIYVARCFLLTSVMIPVSLKVTVDVCKYVYATWIRNDVNLYNRDTQKEALVNNSSVIEDLGSIEYLFTDKTGTLTENEMKLKKLGVRGHFFGHSDSSEDIYEDTTLSELFELPISIRYRSSNRRRLSINSTGYNIREVSLRDVSSSSRSTFELNSEADSNGSSHSGINSGQASPAVSGNSGEVFSGNTHARESPANGMFNPNPVSTADWVVLFFMNLSLCHSVKINRIDDQAHDRAQFIFEGNSPEEVSFLNGLLSLGIAVTQNDKIFTIDSNRFNLGTRSFELQRIFPFSYQRKRMSVVVKDLSTNNLYLFSKGAHEYILRQCSNNYEEFEHEVDTFANLGLRVMAHSYRKISEEEFNHLQEEIADAEQLIEDRNIAIESIYEQFEMNSTMIGVTGIEDTLQEDVAQTIEMLRNAGIHVWMVTGDLMKTAIEIARTTNLIANDGPLIQLSTKKAECSPEELLDALIDYTKSSTGPFYLALDGTEDCVKEFLDEKLISKFGEASSKAKCVICSRTTPKQKADFVRSIKTLNKITLAIGDGGNDVTMIREAHIGVGIMGKEGIRAASASDFAISYFKHLQRLLLVHGRLANYRTSWLTQFCFYKSLLFAMCQIGYSFFNGFSFKIFFADFNIMCYNAFFTLLPVIFFLYDKDVLDDTIFLHPYLYSDSRNRVFCNRRTMFWWVIRAVYHALVNIGIGMESFSWDHVTFVDGTPSILDEAQQTVYSALIMIVILTVAFDTQQYTSLSMIFIWGNWIVYILLVIFANLVGNMEITSTIYQVCWHTFTNPYDWAVAFTITSICMIPVLLITSLFTRRLPSRAQKLRYKEIQQQSRFSPTYLVDNAHAADDTPLIDQEEGITGETFTEANDPETVWDKSHSIFFPLLRLCSHN